MAYPPDENPAGQTILVALCGMSPAVVTETVWALAREGIYPERIILVTTTPGAECFVSRVFDSGVWDALRRNLGAPEGTLIFGPSRECIRIVPDETGEHDALDIAGRAVSATFGDSVLTLLRGLTENEDCRVVFSIAGGRKTMSAIAVQCMSLLAREKDRVVHVLVNPPFDHPGLVPAFYYPSATRHRTPEGEIHAGDQAVITLHDVPFIRCRTLFQAEYERLPGRFSDTVAAANRVLLGSSPPDVVLHPQQRIVRVNGREITLPKRLFLLYWMLCRRARDRLPPVRGLNDLGGAFVDFASSLGHDDFPGIEYDDYSEKEEGEKIRKDISELRTRLRREFPAMPGLEMISPVRDKGVYGLDPRVVPKEEPTVP